MEKLTTGLIDCGLSARKAGKITKQVSESLKKLSAAECWKRLTQKLLGPKLPFSIHLLLYKTLYPQWEKIPSAAWLPSEKFIKTTHLAKIMAEKGFAQYAAFHQWSVQRYSDFWQMIVRLLNIQFDSPYNRILDLSHGYEKPQWFPQAQLNITNSCFQSKKKAIALISQTEEGKITKTSYEELDKFSNRIANSLSEKFPKGEKLAILMPMTREAVALFIAVIKAGCVVVAIPDSFSAEEIATRLRISGAKAVFCQDYLIRDGKLLPLYERLLQINSPWTIVIPAAKTLGVSLRKNDLDWHSFLSSNEVFMPLSCAPDDPIIILFSSGTSGEPKAIPWQQITPLKCGSDAYFHHNLGAGDVFCWPSNLGWMMGPWLIFACLLNQATIALYEGTPTGRKFGLFVQKHRITHLGVVPTLVRTWRNSGCMEGLHWKSIKLLTSTGERSNIDDMLYLMSRCAYKPLIEYCGGTEIAGAYITGTVIQPTAPAAFSTAALGLDFLLLNEEGEVSDEGEVALIPPSIGLSSELLNQDHHLLYYAELPGLPDGRILRRHGDCLKRYANGFYRLVGRADDTMKLSGIKVGSAEIESILNTLPGLLETAAIAINPPEGGPSQLIIFAVMRTQEAVSHSELHQEMQKALKERLNPLFKIHEVVLLSTLPRTASHKVMRRILRNDYLKHKGSQT